MPVITPQPVLVQIGSVPIYWYGVCYALGLLVAYLVLVHEARRKALDDMLIGNWLIIVAAAALVGGRLYHVIDQWALYKDDPLKIILPPYTGLGVYGGIITGTIAALLYIRWKRQSFLAWADVVAPALFAMQMIGRWGNFFNQELYGPPTDLPWGIAIECQHRVATWPCSTYPFETTRFQPLFLYESLSGLLGLLVLLWLARHAARRLRPGDLLGIFFIWYGTVRFVLETLRTENWTFDGIPTAWIFSVGSILLGLGLILALHLRGGPSIADEDARRWAERSSTGPSPEGEPPEGGPPAGEPAVAQADMAEPTDDEPTGDEPTRAGMTEDGPTAADPA
jgi:phosphatidylglycerol:prolipoprotein diacylglycerol transferase